MNVSNLSFYRHFRFDSPSNFLSNAKPSSFVVLRGSSYPSCLSMFSSLWLNRSQTVGYPACLAASRSAALHKSLSTTPHSHPHLHSYHPYPSVVSPSRTDPNLSPVSAELLHTFTHQRNPWFALCGNSSLWQVSFLQSTGKLLCAAFGHNTTRQIVCHQIIR